MEKIVEYYEQPVGMRHVEVIFVTIDGRKITSKKDFEKYKGFPSLNMGEVNAIVHDLKPKTDSWNKSLIVVYEEGYRVEIFKNQRADFEPLI